MYQEQSNMFSGYEVLTSHDSPSCGCLLCSRGPPACMGRDRASWTTIVHVVFFSLHHNQPEKQCFSLKNIVYPYVTNHWRMLGLSEKNTHNWQKLIIDTLSHSKQLFVTGAPLVSRSGYWGLRDTTDDPWTLSAPRNKTRRAQMARYVAATSMQLPVMPTRDISYSPPSSPPSTSAPGPIRSHTTSVSQCSTTLNRPMLPPLREHLQLHLEVPSYPSFPSFPNQDVRLPSISDLFQFSAFANPCPPLPQC